MIVLGLDTGTSCGWALSVDGHVTSGVAVFPADKVRIGLRPLAFKRFLVETKARAGGHLDLVIYEKVWVHRSYKAAHVYGGFEALLTYWCEHHGIAYRSPGWQAVKKAATGNPHASKDEVVAGVRRWGFDPSNDDEADALALLSIELGMDMTGLAA